MKMRLTQRSVAAATYRGGTDYRWDKETACFGLRIYPSGRKSFAISYRSRGKQRFFTVGRFGEMTVQQAREAGMEALARVRRGEDPGAERLAARNGPKMTDLAKRYLDEYAVIRKKPAGVLRDRQLWDRCVLPRMGHMQVADVEHSDVSRLLVKMAPTPAMANKVRATLSKAFNLAEVWRWRPEGTNPCRHAPRYREEARERYLSESELGRLGDALETADTWQGSRHAIAAIRLLILTGCRVSEILKLRWDDVDFERQRLNLPDSKTGPKIVVLNAAALDVLADLEPVDGNPYVIPGRKPGTHYSSLQRVWERVCRAAQLRDVRMHDLRHTFASAGVNTGHALPVIGRLLGHSKTTTTERYAHLADDPVRRAAERIGAKLVASLDRVPRAEPLDAESAEADSEAGPLLGSRAPLPAEQPGLEVTVPVDDSASQL